MECRRRWKLMREFELGEAVTCFNFGTGHASQVPADCRIITTSGFIPNLLLSFSYVILECNEVYNTIYIHTGLYAKKFCKCQHFSHYAVMVTESACTFDLAPIYHLPTVQHTTNFSKLLAHTMSLGINL
jgi:hypothetical protein